jgi:transcriptional regulator with XRE-family HTH domain
MHRLGPEPIVTEASFARQFREAQRQRKLTQVGAAKALGVSQSAIAQWESGRNYPAEELGPKIERVFGVRAESTTPAAARRLPATRPRLPIIGIPAPSDEELVLVDPPDADRDKSSAALGLKKSHQRFIRINGRGDSSALLDKMRGGAVRVTTRRSQSATTRSPHASAIYTGLACDCESKNDAAADI